MEFEIRVERALADLKECLREAIRDRDCCRELADTLIKDINEMSNVQESEHTALRVELDRRGPTPLSIEAECVQLRSWVTVWRMSLWLLLRDLPLQITLGITRELHWRLVRSRLAAELMI